jgi:phosphonate transport system ATP-binding protein
MPLQPHALRVQNLSMVYPNGYQALNNISFTVQPGEFLVIIGLSGSGKSTLLRCLNRLIEPTGGTIEVGGQNVTHIKSNALRNHRASMGMVFQHFNLIRRHSVLNNVLYGSLGSMSTFAGMVGKFTEEHYQRANENLQIVGIEEKAHVRADSLSGGQQQRVAIARALMQNPSVLLADEPVASLDPATSHSVMKYLEYINKDRGTTVICNLHFLSLVRQYATRVIALKAGALVFEGLPEEITDQRFRDIYGEDAREVEIR